MTESVAMVEKEQEKDILSHCIVEVTLKTPRFLILQIELKETQNEVCVIVRHDEKSKFTYTGGMSEKEMKQNQLALFFILIAAMIRDEQTLDQEGEIVNGVLEDVSYRLTFEIQQEFLSLFS